jgi:hypothetical protein
MSEDSIKPGYSDHVCHFCGKRDAGYLRPVDVTKPHGKYFDACEKCARKAFEGEKK